ncbi:MAG TPA: PQQ-dependent sugar dehydrogenase, partial [Terriglobales bacterium]|nr:PQQ-dependent sugar dehydrogenase [Terriglobales bacterium]
MPWGQRSLRVVTLALACLLQACSSKSTMPAPGGGGPPPTLALTPVVSGLSSPVDLQFPSDGTGRMFVVQQPGSIRIVTNGSLVATPFLDITSKVSSGGEMGLLGLAFHPQFTQNHLF